MSTFLSQILVYMSCTFLLGLSLGWLVWSFGSSKERKTLVDEAQFWKAHLEQTRFKRDEDLNKIEQLLNDKANLKKQLASVAS